MVRSPSKPTCSGNDPTIHTVSPAGRDVIGERYRQDVDYGHGAGDLEESSLHVLAVGKATWVVMKQSDGHTVLSVLNDPPEGPPRVEKTYARTTPPQQFRIDTPGLTAMYPVEWVRDQLEQS